MVMGAIEINGAVFKRVLLTTSSLVEPFRVVASAPLLFLFMASCELLFHYVYHAFTRIPIQI